MTNDDGRERRGKIRRMTRRTIMRAAATAPTLGDDTRTATPRPDVIHPDAEVILLCMFARDVDQYVTADASKKWDAMVYKVSELQARGQRALLAKARLLLALSPDEGSGGTTRRRRRPSPEEALLASLLRDLLATDPSEAVVAELERREKAQQRQT